MPPVGIEPDTERRAPTTPTPLKFPTYNLSTGEGNESEASLRDLYNVLSSIKRPQDITPESFRAFNLRVEPDVPIEHIVQGKQMDSLPSLPWESGQPFKDSPPAVMNNDVPYPTAERFDLLKNELLLDNDSAFREATRLPPKEGRQRVRLTQTRKFWVGLERMSQYWDSSLDHYYERPATPQKGPEDAVDKMQTDEANPDTPKENSQSDPMDIDSQTTPQASNGNASQENEETPMVTMYTGRRSGAGHEMPEDAREDAIRAFAEMAAWSFGCQVAAPTLPPRLAVRSLLFPIRQSFGAARSPRDRQLARKGVMEGPVFVGQCRPDTTFRNEDEAPGLGVGELCDLYREVGAMLLAAQERAREGTMEVRPGEGKWWTTKPRWGGAPNDGIEEDVSNSDEQPSMDAGSARKRSKHVHPQGSRRPGNGRKLSNSERWKLVQPGPSLWDKKAQYMQIGKSKDSPFDDVREYTVPPHMQSTQY